MHVKTKTGNNYKNKCNPLVLWEPWKKVLFAKSSAYVCYIYKRIEMF